MGSGGQDIATLRVPAGSYLIMASVGFANQDTDDQNWGMEIQMNGTAISQASGRAAGTGGGGVLITGDVISATTSLVASGIAATDSTITLHGSGYSIHVWPFNIVLVALKVGAIHG